MEEVRIEIRTVSGMVYLHNVNMEKYDNITYLFSDNCIFYIEEGEEAYRYNSKNIERIKRVNI